MERDLRIGSLCTGYGGLDIAALAVFGGSLAWCADNDKHVATILAARSPGRTKPGRPNNARLGRRSGYRHAMWRVPCQDISFSGREAGIEKGEKSGIWKTSLQAFASYDQRSSSWRTLQPSGAEGLAVFSAIWPSVGEIAWGRYGAAIRGWEAVTGRVAPYPSSVVCAATTASCRLQ